MIDGVTRIDTRGLPVERQFTAYRRSRSQADPGIRSLTQQDHGRGHVAVATIWSGHRGMVSFVETDDPHSCGINVDPQEGPVLSAIVGSGPVVTVTDGLRREHEPRSLILSHVSHELEVTLLRRSSMASLRVYRDQLHVSDRLVRAAVASSRHPEPWWAQVVLAASQVLPRLAIGPESPPDRAGIDSYAAGIIELIVRTAAGVGVDAVVVPADRRREHAESYIEEHLLDRSLSAASVASDLGISTRQLERDLVGGPGVSAMIRDARLSYADRLLQDPARSWMTIGAIAEACRFSSQQLFSRSYRTRFGVSPRTARHGRGSDVPSSAPGFDANRSTADTT